MSKIKLISTNFLVGFISLKQDNYLNVRIYMQDVNGGVKNTHTHNQYLDNNST